MNGTLDNQQLFVHVVYDQKCFGMGLVFSETGELLYALSADKVNQIGKLEGDVVECPLHLWHYNIKTGKLLDYLKDVTLQTYKVEARNDGIYIEA